MREEVEDVNAVAAVPSDPRGAAADRAHRSRDAVRGHFTGVPRCGASSLGMLGTAWIFMRRLQGARKQPMIAFQTSRTM